MIHRPKVMLMLLCGLALLSAVSCTVYEGESFKVKLRTIADGICIDFFGEEMVDCMFRNPEAYKDLIPQDPDGGGLSQ